MQSGVSLGPRAYVRACDALTQVIAPFVASTGRRVQVHECFDPTREDALVWSESEPVSVETLSESHVSVALPTGLLHRDCAAVACSFSKMRSVVESDCGGRVENAPVLIAPCNIGFKDVNPSLVLFRSGLAMYFILSACFALGLASGSRFKSAKQNAH